VVELMTAADPVAVGWIMAVPHPFLHQRTDARLNVLGKRSPRHFAWGRDYGGSGRRPAHVKTRASYGFSRDNLRGGVGPKRLASESQALRDQRRKQKGVMKFLAHPGLALAERLAATAVR